MENHGREIGTGHYGPNGDHFESEAKCAVQGVSGQTEDRSVGAKVNRFQALTTFINQQKAERDKLEMELKADGIRLPGMTRARKVKAATRTRKAKGDATASAE